MATAPPPTPLQGDLARLRREGEERAAKRLAAVLGYPYVDARSLPVSSEAMALITEEDARAGQVATVQLRAREVALAAVDPRAPEAQRVMNALKGEKYEVKVFVISKSGVEEIWRAYAFAPKEAKEITGKVEAGRQIAELARRLTTFTALQSEVKRFNFSKLDTAGLLEIILAGALGTRASDIHLETEEKSARLRLRLDGRLHDVSDDIPLRNHAALLTRIKLFSGMKLNVRTESQDGRFTVQLPDKEIEMRVSVIPAEFGETVVMRVLDPSAINVDLSVLGLRPDSLAIVDAALKKPNGLILNTGPTGSGKTTTLYAFLRSLNNPEVKIITIEDPIEYHIQGIEQTQVDSEAGYTFASGLRSIVRQDPDVILVGEIRDLETADIAMQASLTGHLVLSTLHTNDAIGAVPRLLDLGVKNITVSSALSLVIAQRLVRKLCEHCRRPVPLSGEVAKNVEKFLGRLPKSVSWIPNRDITVYEAAGCDGCNGFGYRGRVGIFEFFEGGHAFEEVLLSKGASDMALTRLAREQGMVTMQEDGILKALRGITAWSEVEDVTGPIQWESPQI